MSEKTPQESLESYKNMIALFEQFRRPEYQQAIRRLCAGQGGRLAVAGLEFSVVEGNPNLQIAVGHHNPPEWTIDFTHSSTGLAEKAIEAGVSDEEMKVMMEHVEEATSSSEKE